MSKTRLLALLALLAVAAFSLVAAQEEIHEVVEDEPDLVEPEPVDASAEELEADSGRSGCGCSVIG